MLCLTYLSQPVGSNGGFCSVCASLPRVRLLCPWSYLGLLWVFWDRSWFFCAPVAPRVLMLGPERGKAFLGQRGGQCQGAASTARPCSVSSQGEEMDSAAYPGHLFKSRFFWHPWNCLTTCERAACHTSRWAGCPGSQEPGMLSWQRGMAAELHAAPAQMPVPPEVTLGRAGTGGVWHGHGVFLSREDSPTFCPGLLLLHHRGQGSFWDVFSLKSPLGTAGTCRHPVSSRDSPWRQQHSNYFFILFFLPTSAR